jgi:hypothetical protein
MAVLFNTKTLQPEQVPDDQVLHRVRSGEYAFKKGEKVSVQDPGGDYFTVDASEAPAALEQGYVLEGKVEEGARKWAAEKGFAGTVGTAVAQGMNQALLGIPEAIFDRTASATDLAKKEALKKENDLANTIGGVAGFGASLFTGAPVFRFGEKAGEAVARGIGKVVAAKAGGEIAEQTATSAAKEILKRAGMGAAKYGTEGAVQMAPMAITEAALGDFEGAGESLLAGVGLGALFGAGGSLAKEATKLGSKAAMAVAERAGIDTGKGWSQMFRSAAEDKAVEALNPTLSQLERAEATKDIKKLGRFLLDEEVVTPFARAEDMYQRLATKTDDYGKQIGDVLDELDNKFGDVIKTRADDIVQAIKKEVIDPNLKIAAHRPFLGQVTDFLDNLKQIDAPMSITELNAQKTALGSIIKNWGMDQKNQQTFLKKAYGVFNEQIESKVRAVDSGAFSKWKALKEKYGYLETAEAIAKKSAARDAKNNDFGLTSYIGGGIGAGVLGLPGFVAGMVGREFTRRYGDQIMATGLNKVGGILMAEKAMKKSAEALDRIPSILSRLSTARPKAAAGQAGLSAVLRLTGEKEPPKKQEEIIQRFEQKYGPLAQNPEAMANQVAALTTTFSKTGAPQVGGVLNTKMIKAMDYISKSIPREFRPSNPFAHRKPFKPSNRDMLSFMQKVQVVENPWSVLDELEKGTLTRNHMDALKSVYPRMHAMVQDKVHDAVLNGVEPVPYQSRVQLSLLMDEPMDQSMTPKSIAEYQATYAPQEEAQGGGQELNIADTGATDVQKLST